MSRKTKMFGIGICLAAFLLAFWNAHSFLAVNCPVKGEVLILEGWIPPYTVHEAAVVFKTGSYRRLLIVRPLYEGEPGVMHGKVAAEYYRTVLVRNGVPSESIELVYSSGTARERTYHSALSARKWLSEKGESVKSIDVVTIGPHARRTRLLYRKAFGKIAEVGIVVLRDPTYDAQHWWRSSEGTREVLGEGIAYLYARFFFYPSKGEN